MDKKFIAESKRAVKQVKNHSRKPNKDWKEKSLSFVYRTYDALRRAYEALKTRYKKVQFPSIADMKQSGGLYSGSIMVWY